MNKKRLILGLAGLAALGGVVVSGAWAFTQSMIEATGGVEFCTGCHSMEPMGRAYLEDVHGGHSRSGVQAHCADCHLPHDSQLGYLIAKARTGIHDVWVEFLGDPQAIDWEAKREHRERYVYDSGCLHCHSRLQEAPVSDPKTVVAHRPYFQGTANRQCVSCHQHVGHKDLGLHLRAAPEQASTDNISR